MDSPGAPELQNVTVGQNVFDLPSTLRIRTSRLSHNFPRPKIRFAPLPLFYRIQLQSAFL